jgi:hypothetical protein
MRATPEQKLQARLLLGVKRDEATEVDTLVDALTETELTELARILTEAADAELATTRIEAEGVSVDPADARQLLARRLANLIGWDDDPTDVVIGR